MARNGNGTYSLPAGNPVASGTAISSSTHNTTMSDIATALTQSVASDGQTTPTANLPMGTYRHTNVGDASVRTNYAAAGQVQDSSLTWAGTAGGTANAITLTLAPSITAYAAGQSFTYKSGASANTGSMTAAVSGLATKAIQKNGAALASGDHPANMWFRITYDGAAFQLEQLSTIPASSAAIIPSGTVMSFFQAAAPTGWTQVTTHNNKALRVVSGAGGGSGGSVAFTTAFASQGVSGTVGSTTLTEAQIPSHAHLISSTRKGTGSSFDGGYFLHELDGLQDYSAYTGGGGSHTHTFTGTAINLAVQYIDMIIASKN